MNAAEVQYALDRRNQVDIPGRTGVTDNEFESPIQLGHLTGDVIIESTEWANIGYTGPPGRAVFEYNYTGVHTPPRIFFKNIRCKNPGTGTYDTRNVAFFRVIQPNTSPTFLFADHCQLANVGCYLFDGPDVCGCDGIQIKNMEGFGGSGLIRWRLRDGEKMLFLEINNTRYQTSDRVGPSTDLKNTHGVYFVTYTDEQNANLLSELVGNYEGPLAHRFVNPRGYNFFEHNWNEYSTNWDVESPNCWNTSVRVDDTSGNYGMHFIRKYQTPFTWGGATGVFRIQWSGGHSSANAGSLYVESLDAFFTGEEPVKEKFAGKMFPKQIDPWDMEDGNAATYTDVNTSGIRDRLVVYSGTDSLPVLHGNTRTRYYNTAMRQEHMLVQPQGKDYEEVIADQARVAYGGANSQSELDGSDIVITFKASDTLTVTEEVQVEYLIVGGGGSGGAQNSANQYGGGGGGGAVISNFGGTKITLAPGTYPVVVGTGGAFEWGTYGTGTNGGDSSFNGITAIGGGGGGGSEDMITFTDGASGGSGGGAGPQGGSVGGGSSAYGNDGGSSSEVSGASGGSGGGGAGAVGGSGYLDGVPYGGDGGAGVSNSITGSAVIYAPGGGGGAANQSGDSGDVSGEGGWPRNFTPGSRQRDGMKNIGGGGGGGTDTNASVVGYPGDGGDGVVIIRVTGA